MNYISEFGVLFLSWPKIEPASALVFLVFGCFVKTAYNMGGNNREYLSKILSERAHGVSICFVIFFSRGDDIVYYGPSAYAQHCRSFHDDNTAERL